MGNDGEWLRDTLGGSGVGLSLLGTDETVRPPISPCFREIRPWGDRALRSSDFFCQLPTGRAVIQLSSSTADNSIVLLPGANFSQLSPFKDLTSDRLANYSHLLLQNEIPLEETKQALRLAKSTGRLTTLFNPSPMLTRQALAEFEWQHLDWLIINEGEGEDLLAALADPASAPAQVEKTGGGPAALLEALRRTALGSLTGIIMTRGAEGVVASLRDGPIVEVGPGKVVGGVKDTTGAGDCFTVRQVISKMLPRLTLHTHTGLLCNPPLDPRSLARLLAHAREAAGHPRRRMSSSGNLRRVAWSDGECAHSRRGQGADGRELEVGIGVGGVAAVERGDERSWPAEVARAPLSTRPIECTWPFPKFLPPHLRDPLEHSTCERRTTVKHFLFVNAATASNARNPEHVPF